MMADIQGEAMYNPSGRVPLIAINRMVVAAFFAVGCSGPAELDRTSAALGVGAYPNVVESDGWTVTANNPVLLSDGRVQGSFTFERIYGADTHRGGACMVADLKGGRVRCENQSDCFNALPPPPTGGFHYCIGVSGSHDLTCWTRPGSPLSYCLRSVDTPAGVLGPGTYLLPPVVPVDVDGKLITKWMTSAILVAPDGSHPTSNSQVLDLANQ
jgi:hypothetical protein